MNLLLMRDARLPRCTLGKLYVDGVLECETLEDAERERAGEPVDRWKIPGETAIPRGTYRVVIDMSARFRRLLPLLVAVPGYAGVRIHPGNTHADTEGCILVGRARTATSVLQSRLAFDGLFAKMQAAAARGERINLEVR